MVTDFLLRRAKPGSEEGRLFGLRISELTHRFLEVSNGCLRKQQGLTPGNQSPKQVVLPNPLI